MTSLADVYDGGASGPGRQRLYAGLGLFAAGAVCTVIGIVLGTSSGGGGVAGFDVVATRTLAGVFAGLGLPAIFLGAMTVLPKATRTVQVASWVGAAIAVVGVVMFVSVYPDNWFGMTPDYTLPVTAVYFVGVITTFWSLFVAVANFKARNDPGGTVRLEVTREGETRVVEVSNDRLREGLGGIGLLGGTPDGNAETQTNGPDGSTGTSRPNSGGGQVLGSDGGATTERIREVGGSSPDPTAEVDRLSTSDRESGVGDRYCGNCSEFKYVRTDDGLQPYCGLHEEIMDDMDACEQWTPER
ncbi:ribonuclease BN [Halobacteriales archaeon QH_7_65_31]|nr:MAG: ribonuclease BN [Halobacteriales archaeon QH_7_65_31]